MCKNYIEKSLVFYFTATYTYSVTVGLETYRSQKLRFEDDLKNPESTRYARLAAITHDALDRMVMQSDLRDIYHGVHINDFKPAPDKNGLLNGFYLQVRFFLIRYFCIYYHRFVAI